SWDWDDELANFQSIHTTAPYSTSSIDISGADQETGIPLTLTYRADQNHFFWATEDIFEGTYILFSVTPSGVPTLIGDLDHKTKGLAFAASFGGSSSALIPTEGPLNLYYKLTEAPGGGYDYEFTLRVDEPLDSGANIDGIVFFDNLSAPTKVQNPSLTGPPPPPFTGLGGTGGTHNGLLWFNDPNPGWQPVNVGDQIQWTIRADNIVGEVLWSNFLGNPQAAFRRAIQIPSVDDPVNLYYTYQTNPGGGYDYTFMLRVDRIPIFDIDIDWIVFFDKQNAPTDIQNPVLIDSAPAPYNGMGSAGGWHNGPSFLNTDPDPNWLPDKLGDKIQWKIHADNLVEPILWSNLEGVPVADFRPAIPAFFSFDLYFGSTNPPPLFTTGIPDWWHNPTPGPTEILQSCTDYYWRVVLHNSLGETHSPVWAFKTNQVGDLDQDEDVDMTDWAKLALVYAQTGCDHPEWCGGADVDRDGEITLIDVHHFYNQWLHTCVLDIPE
ncbi:MAG: hypothetical protein GY869_21365, partial [Planctomycetes bacterium]|nr:hypothetical protein [Planctomycetota bacterium]